MRHTSRAVALLLALDSAQAGATAIITNAANLFNGAVYPNLLLPLGGPNFTNAGAQASRTAPYNSCPSWTQAAASGTNNCAIATTNATVSGSWGTFAAQSLASGDTTTSAVASVTTVGSFCVPCIQQNGVWCSRTYSYSLINTATTYQFNNGTTADRLMTSQWTAANTAKDNGSCCGTRAAIQGNIADISGSAKTAAITAANNSANLNMWNAFVCVAWENNQTGTGGTLAATIITQALAGSLVGASNITGTPARGSWWCSNGLYSQYQNSTDWHPNIKQTLPDNANQRLELALVGCPQLGKICGTALTDTDTATGAALTLQPATTTVLTTKDKCTYVGYGVTNPPAFLIDKGIVSSTELGLNTASSWTVHHMEYNNSQLVEQAALDYMVITSSLDFTSKVPQFTMPYAAYAKQRTWYGMGGSVYDHGNWNSPYQNGAAAGVSGYNGKQYFGSVASFASSVAGTDFSNSSSAATFDQRVIRYMPLQVAMNDNAMGAAVATLYNSKKTSYDSAKTMWNNYVAILTKNSKVDAFAAAFSPPKAPTVPPLPNLPWLPDVSATLRPLSTSKTVSQIAAATVSTTVTGVSLVSGAATITASLQPATTDFWIADDSVPLATGGGWGSFTAAVLKFRPKWGKSYGTIGYESSTANTSFGATAAAYQAAFQCATTAAGGACPKAYTGASISSGGTETSTVAANGVKFYVAVSLWSTQNKSASFVNYDFTTACTGTNASCFKVVWSKGSWSTAISALAAPAAMTAATAADSLTGIVGAQALAASAAAAFAAAAALY